MEGDRMHDDSFRKMAPDDPLLQVVDDGSEMSIFVSDDEGSNATFLYGSLDYVVEALLASDRTDTADWLRDAGPPGDVAWLGGIEVSSENRRRGLGSAMLSLGLRELAQRGVSLVFAHALADHGYQAKLERWYKAHGFASAGKHDFITLMYSYID